MIEDHGQRVESLEQVLASILGAVKHAAHDPGQALATIGRLASEALAFDDPDWDHGLYSLRSWLVGECIEDLRQGDGDSAVLTLGGGYELLLRPLVIAGRATLAHELRTARSDDA